MKDGELVISSEDVILAIKRPIEFGEVPRIDSEIYDQAVELMNDERGRMEVMKAIGPQGTIWILFNTIAPATADPVYHPFIIDTFLRRHSEDELREVIGRIPPASRFQRARYFVNRAVRWLLRFPWDRIPWERVPDIWNAPWLTSRKPEMTEAMVSSEMATTTTPSEAIESD